MFYDITPCAKPRQTRRDKWLTPARPCVAKYRAFKDECRLKNVKLYSKMHIIFYMPMPKSCSKKKRRELLGMPHMETPDLDNLIKGLLDILDEDSHIHEIHAQKVWANTGEIFIKELS